MIWQRTGLASFVVTVVGTQAILLYDLWLQLSGRETISAYSREHPWLAWVILSAMSIGNIGLAIHFMGTNPSAKKLVRRATPAATLFGKVGCGIVRMGYCWSRNVFTYLWAGKWPE